MISSNIYNLSNQFMAPKTLIMSPETKVTVLKTSEIISKTQNYDRRTIWDVKKSLFKIQDCKSNLLISSFFRWQDTKPQ